MVSGLHGRSSEDVSRVAQEAGANTSNKQDMADVENKSMQKDSGRFRCEMGLTVMPSRDLGRSAESLITVVQTPPLEAHLRTRKKGAHHPVHVSHLAVGPVGLP